jgi:CPA2 family monovalent cation:H+ antiporter-2
MAVQHDLPLISTVAVGLSLAFVCGLVASKLRISPIVGYLLAGIIIGPYSPGFVADMKIAEELSEIGIVLLMFGVGLHFSLKDLMEVKRIALPGAVAQIAAATLLGAGLAHLWGWNLENGLMFGLALSVASTVVLLRALENNGTLHTMNGRIAIGWLIVEDLAMILALVLIPALASPENDGGGSAVQQLAVAIGKVILFVLLMLVVGRKALPQLLAAVTRTRSRELFTLAVFAMAMGIAFGAAKLFGVSFALGAFFAGMVIRESDLNHEVADRALPFQEAFAVLFFVAVGMLFNPAVLLDRPLDVLGVVAIIMIGKSVAASLIVLLFGYPLKTALLVSAGLAQIGEFSFVLISVGLAYGLLPEGGSDLILAGALISIALNPVAFNLLGWAIRHVSSRPRLASVFNMRDTDLAHLRGDEKQALKELVILVGYGRVGRYLCQNIRGVYNLVIVDGNRERVEALRKNGYHAIAGDGGSEEALKEAAIDNAVAIVVAVPDSFEARRIVETARRIKPSIKVLVRAHNDEEIEHFMRQDVDLALTGPTEIGRRMEEYLKEMKG